VGKSSNAPPVSAVIFSTFLEKNWERLKCSCLLGIVFESEGHFMDDKEIKSKLTSDTIKFIIGVDI
jgi:hypothetical protein